jgi:hypothetical protein
MDVQKNIEKLPTEPTRLRAFARFFKNYISVSTLITASLPIPITAFSLLPTFKQQTDILSIYSSLFCFLLLGYIFYIRHQLARFLFPRYYQTAKPYAGLMSQRMYKPKLYYTYVQITTIFVIFLPALFIGLSAFCVFKYHQNLNHLIDFIHSETTKMPQNSFVFFNIDPKTFDIYSANQTYILNNFQISSKPGESHFLMIYYFGIFFFAEASFVMMAIKEYLQDVLNFSETLLIDGPIMIKSEEQKEDT